MAILAACLILSLAGCTTDHAVPAASGWVPPTPSEAPAQVEPTKALAQGDNAKFGDDLSVKTTEGYTANLSITGSLSPFTKDVVNEPPGKFDANFTIDLSGSIKNTTDGRDFPGFSPIEVDAIYPGTSSLCQNPGSWDSDASVIVSGSGRQLFCRVSLGTVWSGQLQPSGQASLGTKGGSSVTGLNEESDELKVLNSPLAIYAFLTYNLGATTGCEADIGDYYMTDSGPAFATDGELQFVPMSGWPDVLCH
jgi:hypothetical protein